MCHVANLIVREHVDITEYEYDSWDRKSELENSKFVFLKIYLKSLDTDHMYYVLRWAFFHLVQSYNNDNVGTKGFYSSLKHSDTLFYSSEEHFLSDKTRCPHALKELKVLLFSLY